MAIAVLAVLGFRFGRWLLTLAPKGVDGDLALCRPSKGSRSILRRFKVISGDGA